MEGELEEAILRSLGRPHTRSFSSFPLQMTMQRPDESNVITAIRSTRGDLLSEEPRRRLAALTTLSSLCCETKAQQHAVGSFLRGTVQDEVASGTRLLHTVLSDLHTSDRTLRCAAARLLCQLAYENLVNQESIIQISKGFSIGWLHIFSVPPSYQLARPSNVPPTHRQSEDPFGQRGLVSFLNELVADNYSEVYRRVSSYYATGCTTFLPLCWQFPHFVDTRQAVDRGVVDDVPDPAEHVLGFYLVPRQTQFPEQDDFFNDEILRSLDQPDLQRLQAVKNAFDTVATVYSNYQDTVPANQFIHYCETHKSEAERPLLWLVDANDDNSIAPLDAYFGFAPTLSWSNIFTYSAIRLNGKKLQETTSTAALSSVSATFLRLALAPQENITATACVWTPVFVSAMQRDTNLPQAFRRQLHRIIRLTPADSSSSTSEEDWRVLLRTKLEHITPLSWAMFLAQWRVAAELERQLSEQQPVPPVHHTAVCSVSTIRKSIVQLCQPQSYRNLDELRRELPMVSRFASQQNLGQSKPTMLSAFREEATGAMREEPAEAADSRSDNGEVDRDSLSYNLDLFHRMQHSLAELDALSLQKIQEKQREKERVMETVVLNKKRAEEEAARKRLDVEEKHKAFEIKRQEAEQRQALARARVAEREQQKHDRAARRKQQQEAELEAKQQEIMERIQQRERERLQRQRLEERRPVRPHPPPSQKPHSGSKEEPVQKTMTPTRPVAKRPLSARIVSTTSSTQLPTARTAPDPEILRQRALLYGQVVSKIYMAEAASRTEAPSATTEPAFRQPHLLMRSFSTYGSTSFNVKAPVLKNTTPSSARSRRNLYSRALRQEEMKQWEEAAADVSPEQFNDVQDEEEREDDIVRPRKARGFQSPSSPSADSPLVKAREQEAATLLGSGNACTTLVMRSAALAVSERIRIPDVPAPAVEDLTLPPYVIAAQYEALDDRYKRNFRERFNLKCVSHRLSYDVLKQYTKIVRRDMAWQAFHDRCAPGQSERIKYMDFAAVAQALGITLSEKKLLVVARQLDPNKSGYVLWKAFYTWWSVQYSDQTQSGAAQSSAATGVVPKRMRQ